MIWALSILAALTSSQRESDRKARLQQLSGRLGMTKKKGRPSDLAMRLEWALKTFPGSRDVLTFLFAKPYARALRSEWSTHKIRASMPRRDPDDWSRFGWPVNGDPRFPDQLSPLDQPRGDDYVERWPLKGYRNVPVEQMIPFLAQASASQDFGELYSELREAVEDSIIRHIVLDHLNGDWYDAQNPYESYNNGEWYEMSLPFDDYDEWQEVQDPWLNAYRSGQVEGKLDEKLSTNKDWDSDVDDVTIAPISLSWVDGTSSDNARAELVILTLRVHDPEHPSAFFDFTLEESTGERALGGRTMRGRTMRRDPRWRLAGVGPGFKLRPENVKKALAAYREEWDLEPPNDDGTWGEEVVEMWEDVLPYWDNRIALGELPIRISEMMNELPDLQDLFPSGSSGWGSDPDKEFFDGWDEDEIKVHRPTSHHRFAFVPLDEVSNAALWQARWLLDSATAWITRIEWTEGSLGGVLQHILDEADVVGSPPVFVKSGYNATSIASAYNNAKDGHFDRANEAWERDNGEGGSAQPFELIEDDKVVMEWSDGSRIVELTSREALRREGNAETGMDHCIGGSLHQGYLDSGSRKAFSFRDDQNTPIVTIELQNAPGYEGTDIEGYRNGPITEHGEEPIFSKERTLAFLWQLRSYGHEGDLGPLEILNQQERRMLKPEDGDSGFKDSLELGLADLSYSAFSKNPPGGIER